MSFVSSLWFLLWQLVEDSRHSVCRKYINYFNAALSSREDADYHYISSKERAHHNIELAKEFYNKMLELTK